jgi:hypothetical protein
MLLSCGGAGDSEETNKSTRQVYVGLVQGTDALAAVVLEENKLSFYVCGREEILESHTRWFSGSLNDGKISLEKAGWTITGELVDEEMEGVLAGPNEDSNTLSLQLVVPGGLSNLYSVLDSGCRTGAIVVDSNDGSDPLVQGAWCNDDELVKQVTPMTPIELTQKGLGFTVDFDAGPKELFLQPHEIGP